MPQIVYSRNNHAADERQKSRISAIEATLPYTPCQSFLKLPLLDKVIFIQNLPFNPTVTAELINGLAIRTSNIGITINSRTKVFKKNHRNYSKYQV